MAFVSTCPPRAWSPYSAVVALLVICAACSSGSGRAAPSSSSTSSSTASRPTTSRPPVTRPPVTRPGVPARLVVAVPPSIDATGRADVTKALQQFLATVPSGRVVRFRSGGRYRVEGTLFLRGRRGITIDGNGATVFARLPGKPDRSQWWVKGGSRIVFRNIIVRGSNPNAGIGESAYVRKRETQHGFRFEGVNGVELDRVRVHDVFGDFVYVGRDERLVSSRNVWIHDSVFSRNGRQGIAVTAATNVIIERNRIDHTRRSTIDLEPNSRRWRVSNIFVLNNTIGVGRLLFIASHGQGPVDNVVIRGNRLVGHALTIDAMAPDNDRRSNWVVENNLSDVTVHNRPMRFFGIDGLVVRGNRQKVTNGDPGVVLTDVCGARVEDNDFGAGGTRQTNDPCDAALVVPVAPVLPGRTTTGTGGPTSTIPTTPTTPGSITPTSQAPTTSTPTAPVGESDSDGGFDLAAGIFVALGALIALAIVLGLRARRPPSRR